MSYADDIWEATHRLCDKCGELVPADNDMTLVIAKIPGREFIPAIWYARHFLPVRGDDGTLLCEGSPSRAQYIEGQPRDERGYPYDPIRERLYRKAWADLQADVREQADSSPD